MPIDPISDLPAGPYMARSLDARSTFDHGFLPAESHLRYIGHPYFVGNPADIWELLSDMPQEAPPPPFSHKMGRWR